MHFRIDRTKRVVGPALLVVLLSSSCTSTSLERSVQVGGEARYDACSAVGIILPGPDETHAIAVRNAPDYEATTKDEVGSGDYVWMCDGARNGEWTGILYSHREDDRLACGVSGPIEVRQDYEGPCNQGWVPSANVRLWAD